MSAWNKQEGGNHYKGMAIQPMEFALKNGLDYAQSNVIKYVCRHAAKNGKQDLLKAIHNIELMIEHYYGAENAPETPQAILMAESGKHSSTAEKCDIGQMVSCEYECKCHKQKQLVFFNPKTGKCHSCGGVVSGWGESK